MRIFRALLLLVSLSVALVGCGGGGGGGTAKKLGIGTARFSVVWPSRNRGIPVTANSLAFSVKAGKKTAAQVVQRPADGSPSTVVFTNLPTGIVSYVAQAYASTDATGDPISEGDGTVTVGTGGSAEVPVTTDSVVTRLAISDTSVPLRAQDQATISVTAYNAENQVVLLETYTGQEPVAWTSHDPQNITVEGTGPTAVLKALTIGASTIQATLVGTSVSAERQFIAGDPVPATQGNVVILGSRDPSRATLDGTRMTVTGDAASSVGVGTVVASSQGAGLLRKVTAVISPGVYETTTAIIEEAFKNTNAAIRTNLDAFSASSVLPGVSGVTVTSDSFGPVALSLAGVPLGNGATIDGQMTVSADITHEVIVEDGQLTYTKTEPIFHTYSKTTVSGTAIAPGAAEVLLATIVGKPVELKAGIVVSPTIRVYARYEGGTVQTFGVSATSTFDSHVGTLYQLGRWFTIAGTDHTDDVVSTGPVSPGLDVTYAPCRPVLDVAINGIPFTVSTLDGAAYHAMAKDTGLVVDADYFGTFVASAAMFSPTISDYSSSNVVAEPIRGARTARLASVTGRSQVKHPPLAPRR